MREFQRQRIIRKIIYSKLVLFILIIIALLILNSLISLYDKYDKSIDLKEEAKSKYEDVSKRLNDLNAKIVDAESPRGMEQHIREVYPVAKEGEKVIIIYDKNENKSE